MTAKEVLEQLNQQISVQMLEKFNGSSDPQLFKLCAVFTDAIQNVIDRLSE